uniref:Uncharacterized protein n=1 Tax=Nelumbo nucifera TaxID=4432 RepID=A0A822Z3B5_NELNU|nr:TPA_asm: hypothetical protein HUJ06_013326 [Nelumbo nucifera]
MALVIRCLVEDHKSLQPLIKEQNSSERLSLYPEDAGVQACADKDVAAYEFVPGEPR